MRLERLVVTGLESFLFAGGHFVSTITGMYATSAIPSGDCYDGNSKTDFFLQAPNILLGTDSDICAGSDWIVLLIQFLICHALSWWTRWLFWEPAARWFLGQRATVKRVQKFSQSTITCLFHITMGFAAWRILSPQDWLWDCRQWSVLILHHQEQADDFTINADLKFYYLLYAARYISDLISLAFEHPRSDTWAYAAHHIVTIWLVLGSAVTPGYWRIGGVMMFFMDWVDPIMLTAKLFKYVSRRKDDVYQIIADRLFELFAVTFVITRNGMLSYVVWICLRDSPESAVVLKVFCVLLVLLQTFWFLLIVRVAWHQFRNNGAVDDIRSDSEDEDQDKQLNRRIARKKGQ